MRRIAIVGMVILAMVALPLVVGAKPGNQPAKFAVCHIPDDGGEPHVITVSEKALAAHVGDEGHGDILGDECPTEDELPPANTPPVAGIEASLECTTGLFRVCTLVFSSSSFDAEQDPLTFSWAIAGPTGPFSSDSPEVTINQAPSGEYSATLTVSDGEFTDTASMTVILP